ncbi:hypothetical protein WDV93_05885 [Pantoea ananatis]
MREGDMIMMRIQFRQQTMPLFISATTSFINTLGQSFDTRSLRRLLRNRTVRVVGRVGAGR